jgi:hypothetical protein
MDISTANRCTPLIWIGEQQQFFVRFKHRTTQLSPRSPIMINGRDFPIKSRIECLKAVVLKLWTLILIKNNSAKYRKSLQRASRQVESL